MLQIDIPDREYFDEKSQEFVVQKGKSLSLEHSLISISKWESKWKKPFLDSKEISIEEFLDYIRFMTIEKRVDDKIYYGITQKDILRIKDYIDDPMTATWFSKDSRASKVRKKPQTVTSELIYYWMIEYDIPFECEKWHLNRLLTLIKICEEKNTPAKKLTKKELGSHYQSLNAANRKKFNSRG